MKRKDRETRIEEKIEEVEKPKKEFKIEIVKVGKLEENTAGTDCGIPYGCGDAN